MLVDLEKKKLQFSSKVNIKKVIVVCSHERSGTHFLMNSIAYNTYYSVEPFIDFDYMQIGDIINFHKPEHVFNFIKKIAFVEKKEIRYGLSSLIKSHHPSYIFKHLFNDEMINKMKRGAYIVNTARGKICDKDAIARGLESGQLSGYAGDVWFPQPAPNDHVWRTMPNHGMTPHTSGTSLSAQARYAAGVREILECFFDGKPIREPYLIVQNGDLAGMGAHSYTKGTATDGSEEAAKYKK